MVFIRPRKIRAFNYQQFTLFLLLDTKSIEVLINPNLITNSETSLKDELEDLKIWLSQHLEVKCVVINLQKVSSDSLQSNHSLINDLNIFLHQQKQITLLNSCLTENLHYDQIECDFKFDDSEKLDAALQFFHINCERTLEVKNEFLISLFHTQHKHVYAQKKEFDLQLETIS